MTGCPTLAAYLFLRLGWDCTNPPSTPFEYLRNFQALPESGRPL
jgi:hypothetical protein